MFAVLKIDVTKINKDWLFAGKNGAKYLDLIIKDAKDDRYGNDYMVSQSVPKDVKASGTKYGPILGSGKDLGGKPAPKQNVGTSRQVQTPGSPVITEDGQDDWQPPF
jgi:hypothetical protein